MKFSFPVRIYLVALALRLVPVLLTSSMGIGLDDMFQYDMLARSLSSGHGFRWYAQEDLKQLEPYVKFDMSTAIGYDPEYGLYTSFRAPLYPSFLAAVYFFNGLDFSRFLAARLAQVFLLGAPLAPLTYWVAKRLSLLSASPELNEETGKGREESIARIAAWVVACYPMLLVYPLGLGTENLFFVLLLCSFLFLLKSIETQNTSHFIFAGIFLALTTLTRSVILPFAGVAILYLFYLHRKQALLTGLVFTLVLLPWIVRNSMLHHKLTGVETSMGYNLYLGYHPKGNGSFVFGPSLDLLTILDDAQRDQVGTRMAVGFIRDQPQRFLPLAFNRLGYFFGLDKRVLMYFYSNNIVGFMPQPVLLFISAVLLLPFVLVSIASALGTALLKWNSHILLLFLLMLTYILPHVFILSEDRFHLALIPYLSILAACFWTNGWQDLARRWHSSNNGKFAILLAGLTVLLLVFNWGFELARDADKISALLGPNGNQTYFPY
jgi:hypothetical protein